MPESGTSRSYSKSPRVEPARPDRRGSQKAIPIDLGRYLSKSQLFALYSLESFGWHLWFVRRPLFLQTIVVVVNSESHQHAQLEEDGSVNLKPQLQLRH